jgi:RES domain-containing protein
LRKDTLKKGCILWRAQLAYDWKTEILHGHQFCVPCGAKPDRMIPCARFVGDGRVNPRGIPCLYLATNEKTAILEVRPWIGAFVSVVKFKVERDAEIINCTKDRLFDLIDLPLVTRRNRNTYFSPTKADNEKMVWGDINRAFSTPSQREDNSIDYVPTQIISEHFKKNGIRGIAYKSSFGDNNHNVALFDQKDASICGGVRLRKVDDIDIKFSDGRKT